MSISRLKLHILVVLLIMPLILIAASSALGGGNPGPGEKTSGPVVSGVLILFPEYAGRPNSLVKFFFTSGKCRGEYVTMTDALIFSPPPLPPITFAFVDEQSLLNTTWDTLDLPDGCAPDPSAELIIRKVKNFVDLSPEDLIKIAEIEMIFVY